MRFDQSKTSVAKSTDEFFNLSLNVTLVCGSVSHLLHGCKATLLSHYILTAENNFCLTVVYLSSSLLLSDFSFMSSQMRMECVKYVGLICYLFHNEKQGCMHELCNEIRYVSWH